jgi:hypothetical protein
LADGFTLFIVILPIFNKKRRMIPSSNYSAYFQAQRQVIPQIIVQPAKEKSKVAIRYKRNWTKEQAV